MTLPDPHEGPGATAGRQHDAAGRPSAFPHLVDVSLPPHVRRTTLASGLRIVTESMPDVRSASLGVWVGVGSRDESPALHGCSHFLEHVLFKGTSTRSAMDLSVALDEVGGEVNAFTDREHTCFHARVLDTDLPLAVDVLGDMVTDSLITAADVDAEREVILDEIAMHADDPDDVVAEAFAERAWAGHPLGQSVAGTAESIAALSRDDVADFHARHYRPSSIVVSAAGRLDHDDVVEQVQRAFGRRGFLDVAEEPRAPRRRERPLALEPGTVRLTRPFEQVSVLLGHAGLQRGDPRRFALGVLTTALGGGTSSRLFQEVRERRGLAYSVYAYSSAHREAGVLAVGASCLPERVDALVDVVRAELAAAARDGLEAVEVRRGQGQLRGATVLGLEDPGSRMYRLGRAELSGEPILGVDEVLAAIAAVTPEQVAELAAEVLTGPEVLALVGP
ncbi:pitrilysin family protein [Nocardioides lentus]|uniref:Pitrilysin family protein n=1 Tax=Nocardioides lentus TaxID=338077 RepID=A0ABN2P5R2_9ACTN